MVVVSRAVNIINKIDNFRVLVTRTHGGYIGFFAAFDEIQNKTVKMCNYQRLYEGVRWQIMIS